MINTQETSQITKIYLVTNCFGDPNKVYIGKTKTNFRKYHHEKTYGKDIIYTEIDKVESLDSKDWKPLETFWINYFKFLGFDVQNKNNGGGGLSVCTQEHINKIINKKRQTILQYDLEGNFIKEWKGIKTADIYYSSTNKSSSIWACIKGIQNTAYNYIWVKKNEEYKIPNIIKIIKNRSTVLEQLNLKGELIREWENPTQAANYLGTNKNNIYNNINGFSKTSCGYIWRYKRNLL